MSAAGTKGGRLGLGRVELSVRRDLPVLRQRGNPGVHSEGLNEDGDVIREGDVSKDVSLLAATGVHVGTKYWIPSDRNVSRVDGEFQGDASPRESDEETLKDYQPSRA